MDNKVRCQSCGMPLDNLPLNSGFYGKEQDGTENKDFCTLCYQKGVFTFPDLTLEEMIHHSIKFMTSRLKMSEEKAKEISYAVIPNLKRWKN